MGDRQFGILYSCASTAVSDDLVTGSYATLTEALVEMKCVLSAQPGLEAAPMVKAYPEAQWLGLDDSTVQDIIRQHWS
jgi:hypothetical protein